LLVRWLPTEQPATAAEATPMPAEDEPNWRKWVDLFAR
jgi:hypothetical protein